MASLSSLRNPVRRALLALALPLVAGAAFAQAWPAKPITLIVPFPPGGPTDVASRIVAQKMSVALKQSIVIDNRSGASGTVGAATAARAPADGYTFVMLATPTLLASHLYGPTGYDIFKNFTPVGSVYDLPIVLVVNPKSLPDVNGVQDLIAKAKAEGGKLNYTTAGAGSFGHLTTEQLKTIGKFDMQHVPYRGSAPAVTDLIGGQVPAMFSDLVGVLPHIKAGKLRAIAVGSGKRVSLLPDVKTVAEQGFPGFDATSWGGLLAPAGTPKDVIDRMSAALKTALADKQVQEKLESVGSFAAYRTPEQTGVRMHEDFERWGKVIRDNHITNQ
ncbi:MULTISPECIES: Bug family tripartite tricarboxylate transporter substrate binding protein [Variovorax]|jgi:tripartite-type tricarboxylate transporter receptor subunit TctC|uniref:Bug family tripartite tricarboxylate transporter substrate binding protein n=1 Tax=Variovorax TaxID=34072 RepID=UPI00086A30B9|nr:MULTISPECIES: tripartite tricarboxylate transporter substrate binding protein [Variovorax]MBN8757916.1 tripartite tricarboxylate transporter substrate binding protein [Variovorax sp.]ODU16489.1 MAG: ABC transporter substrate-binding protein [Variovorax sp. SCN 67-85]ODV23796.1 MAG: ABC transporter substrate-binding protein [Variovorax sp. SCN 67-20]OJZ12966.1 MAG: ABC transporter substrate-binding protein [Variovorax sp. 67-131]UKI09553.1 tripartite tricarboxylate transporter substrate bind